VVHQVDRGVLAVAEAEHPSELAISQDRPI
jgi:hypothetical protein